MVFVVIWHVRNVFLHTVEQLNMANKLTPYQRRILRDIKKLKKLQVSINVGLGKYLKEF
jgi:Fe-S oxidoreductase